MKEAHDSDAEKYDVVRLLWLTASPCFFPSFNKESSGIFCWQSCRIFCGVLEESQSNYFFALF
jgi:hypothetical protein